MKNGKTMSSGVSIAATVPIVPATAPARRSSGGRRCWRRRSRTRSSARRSVGGHSNGRGEEQRQRDEGPGATSAADERVAAAPGQRHRHRQPRAGSAPAGPRASPREARSDQPARSGQREREVERGPGRARATARGGPHACTPSCGRRATTARSRRRSRASRRDPAAVEAQPLAHREQRLGVHRSAAAVVADVEAKLVVAEAAP